MGTHLQEFSSYPSEVPTDYHKVASANPRVICETQHLVVAARQPSRDPFSGRGERVSKTAVCARLIQSTIKPVDPCYNGVMGVMEQETGLT